MKKILMLILISLSVLSCQKEKISKKNEVEIKEPLCNCGHIIASGTYPYSPPSSWVKVKNECTGNRQYFDVKYSNTYTPGSYWCNEINYKSW